MKNVKVQMIWNIRCLAALIGAALLFGCASEAVKKEAQITFKYPEAKKGQQTDNYHGVTVADPYRWLEDADSAETKAWVEAENEATFGYLNTIPARKEIKDRLTQLWNYERYGVPHTEASRYFLSKNDGLQNQSVLYVLPSLESEPRVLLDPNKLSKDGTVALSGYSISEDGNRMAYGLSSAGSDWQEWRVRDVNTGEDLADDLKWIKFSSASWTHDYKGFFYSRYDEPADKNKLQAVNYYQKLFYHKVGTPQSEDVLVYQRPDQKEWGFGGDVTEDGRYLIISITQGTDTKNRVFYKDLSNPNNPVVELLNKFDASYGFVANEGPVFWFHTDLKAPRGKIIAIDTRNPEPGHWKEVIPEAKETLRGVSMVNDLFVASYMEDAHSRVKIFKSDGTYLRDVALPGLGTAAGFGGKRKDKETFYSFTSFTTPTTIYRYDMVTGKSTVFRKPKVDFKSENYETKQVFYKSKDGTRVPMFITQKKGQKLNSQAPTYLYGYGGFNISLTPTFSPVIAVWLEMGGVFAQPNLRGGGEYGEEWHQAGTKLRKQNVFDDFIGAAEWLIANRYTSSPKLAIGGGSNGGLLVGAAMTQRPDLFGAALPAVGVMDMLRFHKFTIGWAWVSDYGSSDNPDEFKALYAYSPLHHLKPGVHYPATLVTTADHDDRVVPAHSFKFAATLQADQQGTKPVLIRIETRAGHGAGKPTSKIIEEAADKWGFLVENLDMPEPKFQSKMASK